MNNNAQQISGEFDSAAEGHSAEIVELFPEKKKPATRKRSVSKKPASPKKALKKAAEPKAARAEISAAGQALLDKPRPMSGPGPQQQQPIQFFQGYTMMPQQQQSGGLLFKK